MITLCCSNVCVCVCFCFVYVGLVITQIELEGENGLVVFWKGMKTERGRPVIERERENLRVK